MMEERKAHYPACVIAFFLVLLFGILTIGQVYSLKDSYPVSRLWTGSDYVHFYNATRCYVSGVNLYENIWLAPPEKLLERMESLGLTDYLGIGNNTCYCFPPLPAMLNYPLTLFDMETASQLIFFILIVAVIVSYFLIAGAFESIRGHERNMLLLSGLVIVTLSHPFYFLIHRGHQVGIVFLLLSMGIYLLKKENFLCSVCFALAICMSVFPVLIFAPLVLFRRYRYAILTCIFCLLFALLAPQLWLEFLLRVMPQRFSTVVEGMDNCSLAYTCRFAVNLANDILLSLGLRQVPFLYYREFSMIVYALLFCAMVLADFKISQYQLSGEAKISLTLMYFPFMIAIPGTSFHYNLVLIILLVPALCYVMHAARKPLPLLLACMLAVGIFLTQMQVRFIQNIVDPQGSFFFIFPAFGLFMIMVGCVLFKWLVVRTGHPVLLRGLPTPGASRA